MKIDKLEGEILQRQKLRNEAVTCVNFNEPIALSGRSAEEVQILSEYIKSASETKQNHNFAERQLLDTVSNLRKIGGFYMDAGGKLMDVLHIDTSKSKSVYPELETLRRHLGKDHLSETEYKAKLAEEMEFYKTPSEKETLSPAEAQARAAGIISTTEVAAAKAGTVGETSVVDATGTTAKASLEMADTVTTAAEVLTASTTPQQKTRTTGVTI